MAKKKRESIVGINVTPMVDVMLVLLIIMMVSSTYIAAQALSVELPKSASSDGSSGTPAPPAVVTVTKDGGYLFNQVEVEGSEQLAEKLRTALGENPDVSLVVSADTAAMHGKVIHAIDLAKQAGITKFAISVMRE